MERDQTLSSGSNNKPNLVSIHEPKDPSGSTTIISAENGRRLHVSHRRSPSEFTPLVLEQLQLQQQIQMLQQQNDLLQAQQQQLASAGMMGPQYAQQQGFTFPQQTNHRRGQSTSYGMGPPGSYGGSNDWQTASNTHRQSTSGHTRRHSLAVHEAKTAAEKVQAQVKSPSISVTEPSSSTLSAIPITNKGHGRSKSITTDTLGGEPSRYSVSHDAGNQNKFNHRRSGSKNFDNRRSRNSTDLSASGNFVPGHRNRPSIGSFSSNNGFQGSGGQYGQSLPSGGQFPQHGNGPQRKSLFAPYLPQATLPSLMADGRLVSGYLRVNRKNRSDAYVSTDVLDADIFICGSKDRNRALEGDFVAVELLDVDEVWNAKREKEEKKKRKDGEEQSLQRKGSLKQRPTQKKNDDVEVEGQSLLLEEEEEVSDERKPLYAGHVVAVIERTPGQLYSGTLGLLRPSSAATKEKQDAERRERDGGRANESRPVDRPKIVWFKPTDKRVPLIAIPTEQAPKDFVENHQAYANRFFVASIKRWPITSLHPFGSLIEELGDVNDPAVETEALLRDNNFTEDTFSDVMLRTVPDEVVISDEERSTRRDFTSEFAMTFDPVDGEVLDQAFTITKTDYDTYKIALHVADVSHYVRPNSLLDREARKRGSSVYLVHRTVSMLPASLGSNICALVPGAVRRSFSVEFELKARLRKITNVWIGKGIVKSAATISPSELQRFVQEGVDEDSTSAEFLSNLKRVAEALRCKRLGEGCPIDDTLRLLMQLDDENVPINVNTLESKPGSHLLEEIIIAVNSLVAEKLIAEFPDKAILRRQISPFTRRLEVIEERLRNLELSIAMSTSHSMQSGLLRLQDKDIRKGLEIVVYKTMHRAKYVVAGSIDPSLYTHYVLNLPYYTHFASPSRRYADIIVHRQLEAALNGEDLHDTFDSLLKTAEHCNYKKDSAKQVQDQSIHLYLCSEIDKMTKETGMLVRDAVVINVDESAFDVLIPDLGVEKRVHCDQLPLQRAEFNKRKRVLQLYWEKGTDSALFLPADEKSGKPTFRARKGSIAAALAQEVDNVDQKIFELSQLKLSESGLHRSESNSKRYGSLLSPDSALYDSPLADYLVGLKCKEENGEYIQEIGELTCVPVLLRAECSKSPPCLTIRTVNPFTA